MNGNRYYGVRVVAADLEFARAMREAANRSRLSYEHERESHPHNDQRIYASDRDAEINIGHDVLGLGLGSHGAEVFHDAMPFAAKGRVALKCQSEQSFLIARTELQFRMEPLVKGSWNYCGGGTFGHSRVRWPIRNGRGSPLRWGRSFLSPHERGVTAPS